MSRFLDVVASVLVLGAAFALYRGASALAGGSDVLALYWLVAGTVAMRSGVQLLRPAGGPR